MLYSLLALKSVTVDDIKAYFEGKIGAQTQLDPVLQQGGGWLLAHFSLLWTCCPGVFLFDSRDHSGMYSARGGVRRILY